MMCQRIGVPPTSTMGLGLIVVSPLKREPRPPARITAFTGRDLIHETLLRSAFRRSRANSDYGERVVRLLESR
jgi:hypothetical protein